MNLANRLSAVTQVASAYRFTYIYPHFTPPTHTTIGSPVNPSRTRRWLPVVLAALVLVGFTPHQAAAQITRMVLTDSPLIPDTNLGAGNSFRLLFLTSKDIDADDRTGIARYNTHVQNAANDANSHHIHTFDNEFRALVSYIHGDDGTVASARNNTGTNRDTNNHTDAPIYWLNGARVADNYADFYDNTWNSLRATNEYGNVISNPPLVWTGSRRQGYGFGGIFTADLATMFTTRPRIGRLDGTAGPIDGGGNRDQSTELPLYAMSPLITIIAIPDTSLSGLVLSGDPVITPAFNPATTSYFASVPNDITNLTVTPTFGDANANATIAVGTAAPVAIDSRAASDSISLNLGDTNISIVISATALGQTFTTTYNVAVTRLNLPPPVPLERHMLADSLVAPSGLRVGDQFRLLFVDGTSDFKTNSNIGHYNGRVISEVGNNGHATIRTFSDQFRALISTIGVDARDNTATRDTSTSVPIYWVGSAKVADSYTDFYDGSWDSRFPRDSVGNVVGRSLQILTGSLQSGRGQPGTRIGDSGNGVRFGRLNQDDGNEIDNGTISSNQVLRLYGLSPIITLLATGPQPPLVWYPIPNQTATVLIPFSYTFPANTFHDLNMDALTYSVTGPDWLSFDAATRTLSGTPSATAFGQPLATITVTASDGDPATFNAPEEFTLTVEAGQPAAPTNVRAVAGDRSITVLWDPVTEGGGHPVQSYQVQVRQTNPAGGLKECMPNPNNVTTMCRITGLMNGVQYANIRVTVRAGPSATDIPFTSTTSLGGNYILTPTAVTDSNAFITTWRTTEANQTITIPTNSAFTYNYTVDWGDGTALTNHNGDATHPYTAAGIYTIAITRTFPQIDFSSVGTDNRNAIRTIKQWGNIAWSSMEGSFTSCSNLVIEAGAGRPDLSEVTSMRQMFIGASIINQPLGHWDVSKVTDMANMFQNARRFNQDLSNWNVGAVTDMSRMFNQAIAFNQPIGDWDVGAVTDMTAMFNNVAVFNQDLSNWNVSNVTSMAEMFSGASAFNQNLGAWDVGNVGSMSNMLRDVTLSRENYDSLLVGWSTIETDETMLRTGITFHPGNSQYCNQEARDILTETPNGWMITMNSDSRATNCPSPPPPPEAFVTTWAVSAGQKTITIPTKSGLTYNYTVDWGDGIVPDVHTGDAMHTYTDAGTYTIAITGTFPQIYFNDSCSAAIRTIAQWGDDIAWLSMENSFYGCNNLTIAANAGAPKLSAVTSMQQMFRGAASLNSPVNHWDVSSVTTMANMFRDASVFNQDLSGWDVSNVTNMSSMFNGATAFNQNLGAWDVSSAGDMRNMFSNITSLSRENYDSLLAGWSTIEIEKGEMMLQTTVSFGAGNSKYCNQEARDILTDPPNSWMIEGDELDTDDNCTLRFAADTGIANQTYAVGTTVAMVLPSAIGGVAPLSYKLDPLPSGLMLLAPTADTGALLTGVPNEVQPATPVIYTATATDGETSELTFMIKVLQTAPPPPLATLSLGTVSGVDLNLRFPVTTIDGKTYYYLDVDNSGEGDSPDLLDHVVLDNLLNNGTDTSITQEGTHNGNDDARSVIVGTHTLILPTLVELQALRTDQNNSPPSWGTDSHYRSATIISADRHQLFNLETEENQAADDDDNTLLSFVSFQVLRTPDEYLFAPAPAPAPDSVAFFAASERVPSDWPWIPPNVSPNQAFRLLITTWDNNNRDIIPPISGTIDATSADIETYNTYVQDIAAQSNTGIKDFSDRFRALISTPDVDARDNTFTNRITDTHPDARIHWLWAIDLNRAIIHNQIANDYEDFYNGWIIHAAEPGTYVDKNGFFALLGANQLGFPSTPWTGSNNDGTGDEGFEAGNPVVRYGDNDPGFGRVLHRALASSSGTRVLLAMSPRIIAGPSILRLGAVNGIDLTLLGPTTLNGKTYYYWDRSGDGLSDNADAVSHDELDTLLNNGDDTLDTQSGGHIGDDDARSVIIADNLASYTLVLPNTTELSGLLSSHSPVGWSDIAYWSATPGPSTETHETIAYGNGTNDGNVSDTSRRSVAFQLLALAPAAPVIQTVTDESVLIPDADGDGPIVGESFRLLFISSNTINANSDNITVYNRFAQEVAARFPYINFSEQFRALISTPDVDARDNTNTIGDGVPIYWLNGDKVADDYPDFYDGGWDSQDGKSEIRTTPQDTFVMWTGSNSAGTGAQAVGSAAATANTGRLRAGQEISFAPENKRAQRHLYIMSPIIRVASAQSMTVPVDWALIPDIDDDGPDFTTGQSFRLLFITSDTRTATSADIETYNLAVQDTASNATGSGMPIADFSHQFRALISTREVDAAIIPLPPETAYRFIG